MGYGILARLLPPKAETLTKASILRVPDEFDEAAYLKLAEKVGFDGATLAVAQARQQARSAATNVAFRDFLAENGITVYKESRVNWYMNSITPSGHRWLWAQVKAPSDRYQPNAYTKPIPLAVLLTMEKIVDAFPDARFEVTDITEMPKGDPFLRVHVSGGDWFIIERWDEPRFRS